MHRYAFYRVLAVVMAVLGTVLLAFGGDAGRSAAVSGPVGAGFTYQGQLRQDGQPVTHAAPGCDFTFRLYDDALAGNQVGPDESKTVEVVDGLFTVNDLDFGGDAFNGDARWLEIDVQCPGDSTPTPLDPRQPIAAAPYALRAQGTIEGNNARDFGVIGDGQPHPLSERFLTLAGAQEVYAHAISLADEIDWAGIQAALNALPSSGGIVVLPSGAYRINRSLTIDKAATLMGHGYTGAYLEDNWAASVILKDIAVDGDPYDGLVVTGNQARILNLQVDGVPGNSGDGILMTGTRTEIRNVTVTTQGGVGVRVGAKIAGADTNLWRIANLVTLNNTSHGLYIHDVKVDPGPDANAGLLMGLDARENAGDGLRIDNAYDNQFLGVVSQHNTGIGIRLASSARGNSFWMPYVEVNGGTIQLDAGSKHNVVFGTLANTVNDGYVDNGDQNLILGRKEDTAFWHIYGNLEIEDLTINDSVVGANAKSGQWVIRKNATNRALEVVAVRTDATPLQVKLLHDQGDLYVGIGTTTPSYPLEVGTNSSNGNGAHLTGGGVWTNGSDRESKTAFESVDKRQILDKVVHLPITRWRYKGEANTIRHIGPTAQDFHAAFHLGGSDKHIGTIDAEGVALVAVQGLHEILNEKEDKIAALTARLELLETMMANATSADKGSTP